MTGGALKELETWHDIVGDISELDDDGILNAVAKADQAAVRPHGTVTVRCWHSGGIMERTMPFVGWLVIHDFIWYPTEQAFTIERLTWEKDGELGDWGNFAKGTWVSKGVRFTVMAKWERG